MSLPLVDGTPVLSASREGCLAGEPMIMASNVAAMGGLRSVFRNWKQMKDIYNDSNDNKKTIQRRYREISCIIASDPEFFTIVMRSVRRYPTEHEVRNFCARVW